MLNRLRSILGLLFVLSAPEIASNADAGPNEGFTFSLEPTEIVEPLVGDTFEVTLSIQGAVEAKGTLIQAQYDASVLEPKSVTGGTLIPGNQDRAYNVSSMIPGWTGVVPASETVTVFTQLPNNSNLRNRFVWGVVYTYDNAGGITVRKVSAPEFMIIS